MPPLAGLPSSVSLIGCLAPRTNCNQSPILRRLLSFSRHPYTITRFPIIALDPVHHYQVSRWDLRRLILVSNVTKRCRITLSSVTPFSTFHRLLRGFTVVACRVKRERWRLKHFVHSELHRLSKQSSSAVLPPIFQADGCSHCKSHRAPARRGRIARQACPFMIRMV